MKNIWGANLNEMNEMITTMLIQNLNFHIVELVKGCLSAVKVKGVARRHLLDKMITMVSQSDEKPLKKEPGAVRQKSSEPRTHEPPVLLSAP